eukprot:4636665-Prymnesium_polylepis.1
MCCGSSCLFASELSTIISSSSRAHQKLSIFSRGFSATGAASARSSPSAPAPSEASVRAFSLAWCS